MMKSMNIHINLTKPLAAAILALAVLLFMAGCTSSPLGRLGGVDTLINTRPDSALTLLNALLPDTNAMSKRDLMRFYLLRTNAQNKCDTVFTARHASLMRRVCDYYDRRSSKREANNKMLAHYLLGRCYDDMGEAPAALQEFHNAADAADTTSVDCDYHQLSLVHSQCGSIYSSLYLLQQDLDELKKAAHYAQLCNDTLSYLSFKDLMANVYGNLGMLDTLISMKQELASQFGQMGHKRLSAISIGACAYAYIQLGKLKEAKRCMDVYENGSALFLANGDICPGHEIYYFTKGSYYLAADRLDSAEFFFRKEFAEGTDKNDKIAALKGLSDLYRKLHNNDSVAKYATLCYGLNDSVYKESEMTNMLRLKASYNYSRLQKSESQKQEQLLKERHNKRSLIFAIIIIIWLSGFIIRKIWTDKRKRLKEMNEKLLQYAHDKQELQEKKKELEGLRLAVGRLEGESTQLKNQFRESRHQVDSLQEIIGRNEQVIENLSRKVRQYESENPAFKTNDTNVNSLAGSEAFTPFAEYLRNRKVIPRNDNWQELLKRVQEEMPGMKSFLLDRHGLHLEEYKICVLVMLNCSPSDISSILNQSLSYVSKTRKKLLKKVFGKEGKPEEFDKTLRIVF